MYRKLNENNYLFFPFDLLSPEKILGKRLGLDSAPLITDASIDVFSETRWRFLRKQLTAERRSPLLHKASS